MGEFQGSNATGRLGPIRPTFLLQVKNSKSLSYNISILHIIF
jgi:hypothetical protein